MPGYWMHETGGTLRPAIRAYLEDRDMTTRQTATMRAYLRQWIEDPAWHGPGITELRAGVDGLCSRKEIAAWLDQAIELGIDPL